MTNEELTPETVAAMFDVPPEFLEVAAANKAKRDAGRTAYMEWVAQRSRELEAEFSALIAPKKEIEQ